MGPMTLPYDPAEDLTDRSAEEELLEEAFASGNSNFIVVAISAVSRERGLTPIVETLSSAARDEHGSGGPELSIVLAAVPALGYKLSLSLA